MKEPDNIANEDWRLQFITTLAEPVDLKFHHEAGSPLMISTHVRYQKRILSFGLPSVPALFLDFSYNLWKEAQEMFDGGIFRESKIGDQDHLWPSNQGQLFDILEKKMGAIVFAFSALEAFANEYIPEDYIFEKNRDDGRCLEGYNKDQIERFLSLDIKMNEVLPMILNAKALKKIKDLEQVCYMERFER